MPDMLSAVFSRIYKNKYKDDEESVAAVGSPEKKANNKSRRTIFGRMKSTS